MSTSSFYFSQTENEDTPKTDVTIPEKLFCFSKCPTLSPRNPSPLLQKRRRKKCCYPRIVCYKSAGGEREELLMLAGGKTDGGGLYECR